MYYSIDDQHGTNICSGLPEIRARAVAQEYANDLKAPVWLYSSDPADDGEIIEPEATPMNTEYVVINGETLPVNTPEEIAAAERRLSEAGQNSAKVWRSPHSLEWIAEHGDPDGVENGQVLLADTDVDPTENHP